MYLIGCIFAKKFYTYVSLHPKVFIYELFKGLGECGRSDARECICWSIRMLRGVALPVGCPVGRRGSGTSNHRLRLTLAPAGRSSSFGAITEKGKVELIEK